jgi:hypothetical protein
MKKMPHMKESCMRFMKENCMEEPGRSGSCSPGDGQTKMSAGFNDDELAKYSTPELRVLFNEWLIQLEQEVSEFIKNNENNRVEAVAKEFKISGESAGYILTRLSDKNKS